MAHRVIASPVSPASVVSRRSLTAYPNRELLRCLDLPFPRPLDSFRASLRVSRNPSDCLLQNCLNKELT